MITKNVEAYSLKAKEDIDAFAAHIRERITVGADGYGPEMEALTDGEWEDQLEAWLFTRGMQYA